MCARLHMDGALSCWPMQGLGVGRRTKLRSTSEEVTKSCRALYRKINYGVGQF